MKMLLVSRSVMSNFLWSHWLQDAKLLCPSSSPRACSNSCPLVGDAIQKSGSLSSPSPPTFNLSQNQGLFKWVSSSHQMARILEFQLQHQSFQWIFRTDFLSDGLVGSPCSSRDSQEAFPTPQFKSISSLVLSFLYSPTLISIHDYWKTIVLTRLTFVDKVMSLLFNMLSSFVIAFLPRSKCLLILWL